MLSVFVFKIVSEEYMLEMTFRVIHQFKTAFNYHHRTAAQRLIFIV